MIRAALRSNGGSLETKQMTLGSGGFAIKTKVTRRAQFLAEMDKVVPWSRLLAVVDPHYRVAEQGRPRPPVERKLRIYFMQHGSICRIRRWRMRSTTAKQCGTSRGSTSVPTPCRTRA